ncbi:MAG: hypothetical protein EBW14_03150 [Oxalobacteraceae bacterium]|nr:hypothetical protein [Oxalobacteraceae bacterium]
MLEKQAVPLDQVQTVLQLILAYLHQMYYQHFQVLRKTLSMLQLLSKLLHLHMFLLQVLLYQQYHVRLLLL